MIGIGTPISQRRIDRTLSSPVIMQEQAMAVTRSTGASSTILVYLIAERGDFHAGHRGQ